MISILKETKLLEVSEKVRQAAEEMRVVFLSGAVTLDKNYREKFGLAEQVLSKMGYIVLNPAVLPGGLEYDEYLRITLAMLSEADGVCVFDDWAESNGARVEIEEALHKGMPIVGWLDFQKIYLSAKAELDALDKPLIVTTCPVCGKLIVKGRGHKCGRE